VNANLQRATRLRQSILLKNSGTTATSFAMMDCLTATTSNRGKGMGSDNHSNLQSSVFSLAVICSLSSSIRSIRRWKDALG
jgi:hypothetical protein